jgi:cytochrome oxidase assembly protein ShyY1
MLVLGGVGMDSPLLTQIHDNDDQVVIDCGDGGQAAAAVSSSPVVVDKNDLARPSVDQIDVPKVSPAIHAGYAVTWYGLSLAGVLLTRKLILRGR